MLSSMSLTVQNSIMERDLAGLSLDDEEDEILEVKLGHSDSFCQARMDLRVEIAKMGRDLTIKAKFKRAMLYKKWDFSIMHGTMDVDRDGKALILEEIDGKKRARRDMGKGGIEVDSGSQVIFDMRVLGHNSFVSIAAKGQVDQSQ
ncbi:hypothetical protein PVK06_027577 [Gossypium arboreum]|uniref:Uncharacterized protein n=1 Tax=Gossypium arboreum TaxID=29729 RepID=A0ABR0P0Q4_GOSAR|nr:hypothetical protein PVK06_027577 [Gossypium arboreum]